MHGLFICQCNGTVQCFVAQCNEIQCVTVIRNAINNGGCFLHAI